MKKFLIVLIILLNILTFAVYAESNIYNNDRVTFNENVTIDKETNGNVVTFFGETEVKENVFGDVVNFFGNLNVNKESDIDGNLVVFFGNVDIKSDINGDVVVFFGEVNIAENIKIHGSLVTTGSMKKNENVEIYGEKVVFNIVNKGILLVIKYGILIISSIFIFICGMLFIMIFRRWVDDIILDLDLDFGKKIGIGLLTQFTLILAIILFGVLVLPIFIYIILLIIANILTCLFLGRIILKALNFEFSSFIIFIIGFTVEFLVQLVFVYIIPGNSVLWFFMSYFIYCVLVSSLGLGILVYYMKFRGTSRTI